MAMNTRSFILLLATTLLSGASAAADQFVCIFGDRVKFDAAKLKNPTAKIVPSSERYTFIREAPDTATYIPPDGIAGKVFAHENSEVLTFIEKNLSSNLFVVTIFKGKKKPNLQSCVHSSWLTRRPPALFPPYIIGRVSAFRDDATRPSPEVDAASIKLKHPLLIF